MLKIVMEDMEPGEIAAMFHDGEDAIILITTDRTLSDETRCAAVNRLLARIDAQPGRPARPGTVTQLTSVRSVTGVGVFLPHLSEQVTCAAG